MYYTSSVTYMTQYPGECLSSTLQNGTYMTTTPGGLYTMYANGRYTSLAAVCIIHNICQWYRVKGGGEIGGGEDREEENERGDETDRQTDRQRRGIREEKREGEGERKRERGNERED